MFRYFSIMGILFRQSLQRELAFRSNFAVSLLDTLLNLGAGLAGVLILFSQRDVVNGWNQAETLAVLGVYLMVQALKNLFIGPSLNTLAGLDGALWTGEFDHALLNPMHIQFYVSTQTWSPWALFDLLLSVVVLCFAFAQPNLSSLPHPLLFMGTLLMSLTAVYSILLLLASAAFWYLGTPLMWIFDSIIQMGRFPVRIYPQGVALALTWVIPVGLIVTVPAEVFTGTFRAWEIIGGGLLTAVFFGLSSAFFARSLRTYASASS